MHPTSSTFRNHSVFACAISVGALTLVIGHASAQEAPKPVEPAATSAQQPAAAPATGAAGNQQPAPPASPNLPEVEVIQKNTQPEPAQQATPTPKKKPAPVAASTKSPPKPKPAISPTAPAAPLEAPAVAISESAGEAATDAYTPVNPGQIGDGSPGTSQSGAGLGGRFTGYTVTGPAITTKDGIDLLKSPISVQVVPREALDDKKSVSLQDALVGAVSSVQPAQYGFYDGFTIRGFSNNTVYRNNLQAESASFLETANLQSIEVLKGPASMFLGRIEPGGAVNLVLKRPLDTFYTSVEQELDNWGMSRTTIDTTGAFDPAKSWLYRINLAYSDVDTFRDFVERENVFIAPTLSFRPNADFRLNIDLEYQDTEFVADADTNIPAIGTRPANIPIDRYLQNPAVTVAKPSTQERMLVGFDWTYKFAPGWSMTNRFAYEQINYDQRITGLETLDEATGNADRWLWDSNIERVGITTNFDVNGTFHTGPVKHTVLVGTDFRDNTEESPGVFEFGNPGGTINIFNPVYSFSGYVKPADNLFDVFTERWYGVYAQDMISLFDERLHFLFGGRYDWADNGQGYSATSMAIARSGAYDPATGEGFRSAKDEAFSPRAGIILQPQPWLSFYGSYSRSFGSTNAVVEPGAPSFDPEEGEQWEGGIKSELLDKRLTVTMAYFDITKTNIVQDIPGTIFSRPVGEVESKGFELDIAGRLDRNWSILANYAYADAVISEDEEGNEGNRLMNVPRHAGSAWLKYDFMESLRGFSLGGGVTAMGDRPGDNENSFVLPSFVRFDAMAQYELPEGLLPWGKVTTLQLNVNNVFDEIYYTNSSDRLSIFPGDPRTYHFSLRSEF